MPTSPELFTLTGMLGPMLGSHLGGSTHRGQMLGSCQNPPFLHRGNSAPDSTISSGLVQVQLMVMNSSVSFQAQTRPEAIDS